MTLDLGGQWPQNLKLGPSTSEFHPREVFPCKSWVLGFWEILTKWLLVMRTTFDLFMTPQFLWLLRLNEKCVGGRVKKNSIESELVFKDMWSSEKDNDPWGWSRKKLKKKDKWKKNIWILKIFWAVKRAMTSEPHNNVSQKRITQWLFCYIFRYVKEFQGK